MSKASAALPAEKLLAYEKLVATLPEVERKGAAMPYTSVNGHMFSFLTKDGKLALRLPDEEREALLKKRQATLCQQHGVVMQDFVEVSDALLSKTRELAKLFARSYEYVAALKPKPTTRKPAARKAAKKTPGKKSAKK